MSEGSQKNYSPQNHDLLDSSSSNGESLPSINSPSDQSMDQISQPKDEKMMLNLISTKMGIMDILGIPDGSPDKMEEMVFYDPEACEEKLHHEVSDLFQNKIFRKFSPREQLKRNPNFIKFLIKMFRENFQQTLDPSHEGQILNFISQRLQQIYEEGQKNIRRESFNLLFGAYNCKPCWEQKEALRCMRQLMNNTELILSYIFGTKNIRAKNKKNYFLLSKVYKLRCRNHILATRVQLTKKDQSKK